MINDNIVEILAYNAAGKKPIMKAYREIVKEIVDHIKEHVEGDRECKSSDYESGFEACKALLEEASEQLTEG